MLVLLPPMSKCEIITWYGFIMKTIQEKGKMISDEQFRKLTIFIKNVAGIELKEKRVLVTTRLESFAAKNSIVNIDEYLDKACTGNSKESETLINILTTNHTFFWREEQHFLYLLNKVLPELKVKCLKDKDIRIWCSASSTGEEPYTLAIVLAEFFGIEHMSWDTTVLATDISTEVLKIASKGMYPSESIRNLPKPWQQRYFNINDDVAYVKDNIRNQVLFRRFNLMDQFPFKKKLDVVFCRNVLIYFDDNTRKRIVEKIADNLKQGGYLFIGTTESVNRLSDRLEYVAPSVYKKV